MLPRPPQTRLESGCQTGRRGYHLAVVLEDVSKVKETLKLLQGGRSGPETVFPAEWWRQVTYEVWACCLAIVGEPVGAGECVPLGKDEDITKRNYWVSRHNVDLEIHRSAGETKGMSRYLGGVEPLTRLRREQLIPADRRARCDDATTSRKQQIIDNKHPLY